MYKYKFIEKFKKSDIQALKKVSPYIKELIETGAATKSDYNDLAFDIADNLSEMNLKEKQPSHKQCMALHIFLSKNLDAVNELAAKGK